MPEWQPDGRGCRENPGLPGRVARAERGSQKMTNERAGDPEDRNLLILSIEADRPADLSIFRRNSIVMDFFLTPRANDG